MTSLHCAVWPALGAAFLFGASTPFSKQLMAEGAAAALPFMLAGLLYLGSGIGLALIRLVRDRGWTSLGLPAHEWPWLLGAISFGGVLGHGFIGIFKVVVTTMQTLSTAWIRGLCVLGALCATWGSIAQPVPDSSAQAEVFVQTGNSLLVTTVRFSKDGKRIASCDAAGFVVGWDSESGRQYRDVHRHVGMCLGLAFTPDGEAVISSGGPNSGNEVVMSRWVDGQVLQKWEGHSGEVADLVATRDGTGAWTLGGQDGLQRWALGAEKPLQVFPLLLPGEVANSSPFNKLMALTSDHSRVFVARKDGSVLVLDLKAGAVPQLLVKLPETISSMALSPDGKMLALSHGSIMGSTNKDVLLLDAASGHELRRLNGHEGNVSALAFSSDGALLASAAQIDMQTLMNGRFRDIKNHEALRLWRVQDRRPNAPALLCQCW